MMASLRRRKIQAALGCVCTAAALLGGCGGGGGSVGSTPPPPPAPAPAPAPPPDPPPTIAPAPAPTAPTPTSPFDTAEYRQSDGPSFHRAIPPWEAGATGRGVTLAIVDSGIDIDSPEFAGRISSVSADVAGGGRTLDGEDDHGSQVALVAGAARNNAGILGMAFDATIQVLRADTPGSCATETPGDSESGCKFSDDAIATGIDRALGARARVVNLSIGGSTINSNLRAAIGRAAAAGLVVIVSAGNGGDSTDPADNPSEPDLFASSTLAAGSGNVIIAGSVDQNGVISDFSNRAGSTAPFFLNGLGEQVCCVYEDGSPRITTQGGRQFVTVVSGTSFSAPQISGAVALLAQAFPNLSGSQIVDLLLRTARDAGVPGTDVVYGRGILDIANAFAPQGATRLAGSAAALPLGDDVLVTGGAMGDAGGQGPLGAVILDGYSRAFAVDFARSLRHAPVAPRLAQAIAGQTRRVSAGNDQLALAFSLAESRGVGWIAPLRLGRDDARASRVLAANVAARLAPDKQVGFAFREGAGGLVAQLQGARSPAFMLARGPGEDLGFASQDLMALAYRQTLGGLGLTLSAQTGSALTAPMRFGHSLRSAREDERTRRLGIALDKPLGPVDAGLGVSWLHEDRTVLGARFHTALGRGGADSLFLDASAGWSPVADWRIGAALRAGLTMPRAGGAIGRGARLLSSAFWLDLEKVGAFARGDRIALRVSQPLRVERGGVALTLPIDYDYARLEPLYGDRYVPLAPRGRELIGELAWRGELWGGDAAASLFYRKDPGHFAAVPDDKGVAIRWSRGF